MTKAKEDGPNEKYICPNACSCYLGNALETHRHWPRGPMDKASAYEAGDCRFESCRVMIELMLTKRMVCVDGNGQQVQLYIICLNDEKTPEIDISKQHGVTRPRQTKVEANVAATRGQCKQRSEFPSAAITLRVQLQTANSQSRSAIIDVGAFCTSSWCHSF